MAEKLSARHLRDATPAKQAAILRETIRTRPAEALAITEQLFALVASGLVAPTVADQWLSRPNDPRIIEAGLRQQHSSYIRRAAIKGLRTLLRRDGTFEPTWQALGGPAGIAQLLAGLSLADLRSFLKAIYYTARAQGTARTERQHRIVELFHVLNDPQQNPEVRSVKLEYAFILPACTPEMALKWRNEIDESEFPGWTELLKSYPIQRAILQSRVREAHWQTLEQQAFDKSFESPTSKVEMKDLQPYISRSLSFAIKVLRALAESETLRGATEYEIMVQLILRHAKRRSHRKATTSRDAEFWETVLLFLEKHSFVLAGSSIIAGTFLDNWTGRREDLTFYAVTRWGHLPKDYKTEEFLAKYLGLIPRSRIMSLNVDGLMRAVRPQHRYRLLRLFFQQLGGFDIGPPSSSESSMLKGVKTSINTFLLLPIPESATFFERFVVANPGFANLSESAVSNNDFMSIFLPQGGRGYSIYPDGHALRAFMVQRAQNKGVALGNTADVLEDLKTNELNRRKKEAAQGRKPEERMFWAAVAIRLCVAMGDLDAYADILLWARRFNKDPMTIAHLYGMSEIMLPQTVDLLCALSDNPSVDSVKEKVLKANKIMLLLVQTATMALREPSFQSRHWEGLFKLLREVVEKRLLLVGKAQNAEGLSDDIVFEKILQPTIDLLIEIEAELLEPEHSRLEQQNPNGLLLIKHCNKDANFGTVTVNFLDDLAERRNELWTKHRTRSSPSVITLESPWPRGLPFQCLWPQNHHKQCRNARYIQKRAEDIVFCPENTALAPLSLDDDTRKAIGPFVDSWPDALRIYISGADNKAERVKRINKALSHALGPLTGTRMTSNEAKRFWHPVFRRAEVEWEELGESCTNYRYPASLPVSEPSESPVEWDPDPEYHEAKKLHQEKKRLHDIVRLDCMLVALKPPKKWWYEIATKISEPEIPEMAGPASFWGMYWIDPFASPVSVIDSQIATAVLCLNSSAGADTSLLMQPFPNQQDTRFPAVYLDQEFLEREGQDPWGPLSMISHCNKLMPPRLLAQLAESMLRRIDAEPNESRRSYKAFTRVVKLLANGDRPALAVPLIQRFVIEYPLASAWHRELFHAGNIRRLGPSEAEEFLYSMARLMIEKLRKQRTDVESGPGKATIGATVAVEAGAGAAGLPPLVKVTTVKMLAQLLQGNSFVKPTVAVDALTSIVQHGTHIDIRTAAIDAIVSTMGDPVLDSHILDILRTYAIPIASALNERRPETAADWEAAENGGPLPTVLHTDESHVVLDMFMAKNQSQRPEIFELATESLRLSTIKNSQWQDLFLKKHGLTLGDSTVLPVIPAYPELLRKVFELRNPAMIPLAEFKILQNYLLVLLDPPKPLQDVKKSIKENKQLAESNAGKHWLHLWDVKPMETLRLGGTWVCQYLNTFASMQREGEKALVSSDAAEGLITEMAKSFLLNGNLSAFNGLVGNLSVDFDISKEESREDLGGGRVLRHLIEHIDSLRTPEWQANRNRRPHVLPSTLPLRLDLIQVPALTDFDVIGFAAKIDSLLKEIVASGRPYHDQYLAIEKHCTRKFDHRFLHVAVRLGSPSHMNNQTEPTLVDHLRAKIAAKIVQRKDKISHDEENKSEITSTRAMLAAWKESVVEEFRELATAVPTVWKQHRK